MRTGISLSGRLLCLALGLALTATPGLAGGANVASPVGQPPSGTGDLIRVGGDMGLLKICKIAGPGIATGSLFTFIAGDATMTVPAGVAPGGACAIGPMLPVGTVVTVAELVPSGTTVSEIAVAPVQQLSGTPNLSAGSVMVQIGTGVTEVTFTNKRTGFVEICKTGQVRGDFRFIINPGSLGPFTVAAGSCSPAIEVESGTVVITELAAGDSAMVGCSTLPPVQQIGCDTTARTSTVQVDPGDISTQTIAFVTNQSSKEVGTITITKVVKNETDADLTDMTYHVTLVCDPDPAGVVLDIAEGRPAQVDGVPFGTECKLTEDPPAVPEKACPKGSVPQWSSSQTPAGVLQAGDTVTVTNLLECIKKEAGTITILKVVRNHTDANLADLTYAVTLTCDPGSVGTTFDIAAGSAAEVDGIPVNADCKLTEDPPPLPEKACPNGTRPEWSTSVSPDGYLHAGDSATVTNRLDCVKVQATTGEIKIVKVVKNNTRADLTELAYQVTLSCDPGPQETVAEIAQGHPAQIADIPLNADCKLTEDPPTLPEKACPKGERPEWSTSISPTGYLHAGDTAKVTNTLDCVKKEATAGSITVVKQVKNNSRADLTDMTYQVGISCDAGPETALVIAEDHPAVLEAVPLTAECKLTEDPPAAPEKACPRGTKAEWSTSVTPAGLLHAGDTATVTNTLDCIKKEADLGSITISKVVQNNTRADLTDMTYQVTVSCDTGPDETVLDIAEGHPAILDTVPLNAECKLTEDPPPLPEKVCPKGTKAEWTTTMSPDGPIYPGDKVTVTNLLDCVKKAG